jgi:hypothetical protein
MATQQILAPLARQIQPILATFVPATAQLSLAELAPVLARVDERLADEPPALQRQLRLFVRILWWLPLFTNLRTMGSLTPPERLKLLSWLQDCSVTKLRLGLWGLRTLLFLGWYGDPAVQAKLGYRPNVAGWEAWNAQKAQQKQES